MIIYVELVAKLLIICSLISLFNQVIDIIEINNSIVRSSSCPLTKTTQRQYEDTNEVNMQKQKTHILCYLQKV